MTTFFARHALLPSGPASDVTFEVTDGYFTAITAETRPASGTTVLPGVVLPGLANCHSHAFHRALRGRTHAGGGTFWTWREGMYAVAAALDPDSYLELARATYAEMALAGITAVGEFHYLHHAPGGARYADPNAMGRPSSRPPPTPASGCPCSTPAISPAVSDRMGMPPWIRSSCGSATGPRRRGRPGSACSPAPTRSSSARPCIRCGQCRAPNCRWSRRRRRADRCTCTCPSSRRRTRRPWPSTAALRPSCSTRPGFSAR